MHKLISCLVILCSSHLVHTWHSFPRTGPCTPPTLPASSCGNSSGTMWLDSRRFYLHGSSTSSLSSAAVTSTGSWPLRISIQVSLSLIQCECILVLTPICCSILGV